MNAVRTSNEQLMGPPFTVPRYGSFGACVIAERDWLREALQTIVAMWEGNANDVDLTDGMMRVASEALTTSPVETSAPRLSKAHAKRILQDWIEDESHAELIRESWPDLFEAHEALRAIAEGLPLGPRETSARYTPRVRRINETGYTPRTEVEMVADVKGEWIRYSPVEPSDA